MQPQVQPQRRSQRLGVLISVMGVFLGSVGTLAKGYALLLWLLSLVVIVVGVIILFSKLQSKPQKIIITLFFAFVVAALAGLIIAIH